MWLIDTSSLQLKYFVNPPADYAILSHTWGDDEVTFQDLQDHHNPDKAKKKKDFAKIEQTCRLALERNLAYAWVDTCCIDKSSSAELSEAINSMFEWYRGSAVCFVFLSDLQPVKGPKPGKPDIVFEKGFPQCKWLTRGWTLQELIAPGHVEFYDKDWTLRTTKAIHRGFLSQNTGIDDKALGDSSCLSEIVLAKRMSWAAERETTRIEDKAYCLMGIFDIHMPMIYGEGNKAFMRLQESIALQSCDLSLFAWAAQPPNRDREFQNYRGIFAKSPAEFANCRDMRQRNRGLPIDKEFTITNKGLRLQTTLVGVSDDGQYDDLVMNLGVCDRDWGKNTANGWIGVYLIKTTRGYVRSRPDEMYIAGQESWGRTRCDETLVHIRKDLSQHEAASLPCQYLHAVCFPTYTGGYEYKIDVDEVQPEPLWDGQRMLVLDRGSGLNVFAVLKFSAGVVTFQAIVACSTIDLNRRICTIWSEQDKKAWQAIRNHMRTAKEITDYVTYDYLKDYFDPFGTLGNGGTCSFKDPDTGGIVQVTAELENGQFENMDCFCISIKCSPVLMR